jgi:hypothetical protein
VDQDYSKSEWLAHDSIDAPRWVGELGKGRLGREGKRKYVKGFPQGLKPLDIVRLMSELKLRPPKEKRARSRQGSREAPGRDRSELGDEHRAKSGSGETCGAFFRARPGRNYRDSKNTLTARRLFSGLAHHERRSVLPHAGGKPRLGAVFRFSRRRLGQFFLDAGKDF